MSKASFLKTIKERAGIIEPKNYINPKLDTSESTMKKVRERNRNVQQAQKKLNEVKEIYQTDQKFRGSEVVKSPKRPPGYLYKAEQEYKKVLEKNPSIDVGQKKKR